MHGMLDPIFQDNTLSKDEVKIFILRALKEGIFSQFFRKQDKKVEEAVDTLFDEIFLDAFINQDDELISKQQFGEIVADKLDDDQSLREVLLQQFDQIDKDKDGYVDQQDCKVALTFILKAQIEALMIENEETQALRNEEAFKSGLYAKQTIEEIVEVFKRGPVPGDDETFMQISDLLSLFYDDREMNTDSTMVKGTDFCEMLALFFDLTDAMRNNYIDQLEKRNSHILDLQASITSQKIGKTKKTKKKKGTSRKDKMEKSLNETQTSI